MKNIEPPQDQASQPGGLPAAAGYVTCPECCGAGRFRRTWKEKTSQGGMRAESPCYHCMGTGRSIRSHTDEMRDRHLEQTQPEKVRSK